MKPLSILIVALAALVSFADDAKLDAEKKKIAALVKQLGDADWRVRQKATKELDKIGPAALEAVKAAAKSNDAEVAARAERILAGWRAFLGVEVSTTQLDDGTAPVVRGVISGTAAEKAGLQVDDLLVALEGLAVATSQEFVARVQGHFAGERVELIVRRKGEEKKMVVELGLRPADLDLAPEEGEP